MFSDKIIKGHWMKFMAINAVTDLKYSLFCFRKGKKIIFENSLTFLWSTTPGKNYPSRLIALIHFSMHHDHVNFAPEE